MLRFKQKNGGATDKDLPECPFYNGFFSFFFSNKRTIDKLKLRIVQAISE